MHLHNGNLDKESGYCYLDVDILDPTRMTVKHWKAGTFTALIDTGASETYLKHVLAKK